MLGKEIGGTEVPLSVLWNGFANYFLFLFFDNFTDNSRLCRNPTGTPRKLPGRITETFAGILFGDFRQTFAASAEPFDEICPRNLC